MNKLFITITLLLFSFSILFSQTYLKFDHLTVDDGLSNNFITSIAQDSLGYMWIATEDGLNKYDGYNFTVYRHDPTNPYSLSENKVQVLHVDKTGRLWIGTQGGGLNSFNPETEKFTRYSTDSNNPEGFTGNSITSIYEDKSGLLWFCVQGNGLYSLNPVTNAVKHYSQNPKDPNTINNSDFLRISGTYDHDNEYLWICTWGSGLIKFDPLKNQWTQYLNEPDDPNSLCDNYIEHIYTDNFGALWLSSTWSGIDKFDTKTGQFTNYQHNPANPNSLCDNAIDAVWEKDGKLWITTMNGLSQLDIEKNEFKSYFHNPSDPSSIGQNDLWTIYESKSGLLWIGGWSGLDIIDFERKPFNTYRQQLGDSNSLSDNFACSILTTEEHGMGVMWIGTKDGGLNKINRRTGKFTHYRRDPDDPNSLSDDFIFSITESTYKGKKELWLGTMAGLNRFDPQTEKFLHYRHNPADTSTISEDIIHKVYADRKGSIWIGTRTQGMCRFDPVTQKTKRYHHEVDETWVILEDSSGFMWNGTINNGLYKLDPVSDKVAHYVHNPQDSTSISSNTIRSIHESVFNDKHVLWIGTNAGLNRFDYDTEQFSHYSRKTGLPNDEINGILEDKQGNLWLGTGEGLAQLNPHTGKVRNYDLDDGLPGNQFLRGGYFRAENGEMFFGGTNGFTSFFPEQIKYNLHVPEIVLTDFQIFNKSVPIKSDNLGEDDNYFLPKHISTLSQIELSYSQSVFSFEFAALDFRKPQKNQYAYLMEDVDPEWVYTDASRRFVTYTNLDPGAYIFRVKGSNNDGHWNNAGISIKVIITPPWWETNLAYAFYILFFISVVFTIWRTQLRRIHIRQQLQMEHFEADKLREVDRMKSRFFADISHEFRTPLTLIAGPVKQLLEGDFTDSVKEQFKMILRSSNRLLGLINQILDLSKLESGEIKLKVSETNIIKYQKGLILSFSSLAESRKVTLKFTPSENSLIGYIDRDKLEKIVTNLLSNAFKFTPDGGKISVGLNSVFPAQAGIQKKNWIPDQVRNDNAKKKSQFLISRQADPPSGVIPNSDFIEISISNTGPGIPPDQLDKIFNRFYQADDNYKKDGEGSGIGLALTKELVDVCKGKISVESIPNKTTIFTVVLPVSKEYFNKDEIVKLTDTADRGQETGKGIVTDNSAEEDKRYQISASREISDSKNRSAVFPTSRDLRSASTGIRSPLLLIVEDNPDVTRYICSFMNHDYRIVKAGNGIVGLKIALNKYPDLIISDVMMPEMDGFELCRKIKSDECISHIPVILLTAKADLESKIEGLEFGADDYVTKPFEARELQMRSRNLIEQRKILRDKFSRMIEVKAEDIATGSKDEQFLKRLIHVFEAHVDESDFSTKEFAREVGMSRSNLHRKLVALTNQSTHEFLRTLRLKRAAQLLKQAAGTVTEIAYTVGFTNPSHFSKIFRQHFGQTPSEFSNDQQMTDTSAK